MWIVQALGKENNETLLKSYAGAVTASLTLSLGLATAIKRNFSPLKAARLLTFVAFPSSVVASSLNCAIVR